MRDKGLLLLGLRGSVVAERLAGKSVFKMANLMSSGTLNLNWNSLNKKHLKNVGPIRHCEPPHDALAIAIHQVSLLSHTVCASMSTTTTTTRYRGDRYGPIEWAQSAASSFHTIGHNLSLYTCRIDTTTRDRRQ